MLVRAVCRLCHVKGDLQLWLVAAMSDYRLEDRQVMTAALCIHVYHSEIITAGAGAVGR
jgi:hypothetical protein